MENKEQLYRSLVEDAREDYLSRPRSSNSKGVYLTWAKDCQEINLWTYWQGIGNYNASIVLVGQDWGFPDGTSSVMKNIRDINCGLREDYEFDQGSPTDGNLCKLFSVLGYDITRRCKDLFFTNFILGYRSKGCSGNLSRDWLASDAPFFARLVNIIEPRVVICLGKDTFENVQYACTGKMKHIKNFSAFIESTQNPVTLPLLSGKTTTAFAVAHCGTIGTMNRNRSGKTGNLSSSHSLDRQIEDWTRINTYLKSAT